MHFRAAEAIPLQQAPPDSSLLRAQPPDTTLPLESRPPSRPPSIPDLDLEPIVEFAREQKQFPITKANSIFVE
jgi:copper chaperone CopZ